MVTLPSGSAVVPRMIPMLMAKSLVEQEFFAADRQQRDQVLGGPRVDFAAAEARIDERAETYAADVARAARGDVAEQVRYDALRQVVGLDPVLDGHALQGRDKAPMAAHHTPDQAVVAEMVEAFPMPVALAGGVDESEIPRLLGRWGAGLLRPQMELLQRDRNALREADADEAARRDCVSLAEQSNRFSRGYDLAAFGTARGRLDALHG
jgi:hypothetical protein